MCFGRIGSSSTSPCVWVDRVKGVGFGIDEVIRYPVMEFMPVMKTANVPVKITENEKTGEKEPGTEEGVRNPDIQIGIVRRRWIVCHNRWTFIVVIIIYDRRIGVTSVIRRCIGLGILPLISADR